MKKDPETVTVSNMHVSNVAIIILVLVENIPSRVLQIGSIDPTNGGRQGLNRMTPPANSGTSKTDTLIKGRMRDMRRSGIDFL